MILAAAAISASLFATALAATHDVAVGGLNDDGEAVLRFDPPFVNAEIGDYVRFTFRQKNHTVYQTSFGNVCRPLDGGFQLDQYYPVDAEETDFPTEEYYVQTTDPLWFYCPQTAHCGRGMVFSINCPTDPADPQSLENFIRAAEQYGAYEAASSSWAATASSDVYGGQTYAPIFHPTVTATVSHEGEVWTTTYESYPDSPDPTPDGRVIDIEVGEDEDGEAGLFYSQGNIVAAPRDVVVFHFRNKNHTVTQSSFGNPCRKLEFTSTTGQVGFDSDFTPVDPSLARDAQPEFRLVVNDTAPIYGYCRQGNHCGAGMVFTINAVESSQRNFAAFRALAQTVNGTGAPPSGADPTGETAGEGAAMPSAHALGAVASMVVIGIASIFITIL